MEEALIARYGVLPATHHVPDVLTRGLSLVFCGTALGYTSASQKAYYAHPGNLFWKTLYCSGLTPRLIVPQEYACMPDYGIGLTDLCKNSYGLDNQLPKDALNTDALYEKMMHYQPDTLAFTSKSAASAFLNKVTQKIALGLQKENIGKTKIFVLPSPSGQARIFWDEKQWKALADLTKRIT